MIISSAEIQLASSYQYLQKHETSENLTIQQDGRRVENPPVGKGGLRGLAKALAAGAVKLDISAEAAEKAKHAKAAAPPEEADGMTPQDSVKFNILRMLIERLTGRKVQEAVTPADVQTGNDSAVQETDPANQAAAAQQPQGWGMAYDYHESYSEVEIMQFSAQGKIQTADGQTVDFSVELTMSRSFASELDLSIEAGDKLKDPLVVNFEGSATELTQTSFSFDLDVDGSQEQIASLAPGSGLLALDSNNDGRINDGSELFGPTTGDGFAELARYDTDQNNWIDENDGIFKQLRVWQKDAQGEDHLFALGSLGIGAIYLGHAGTPFAMKDSSNELQAQVRSTGVFLRDDLTAGTVQQIDMVA